MEYYWKWEKHSPYSKAISSLFHLIEKSTQKDFEFFLKQGNFLKVVDTLNKFEEGILDSNSPKARDFVLFKRHLYAMYEV